MAEYGHCRDSRYQVHYRAFDLPRTWDGKTDMTAMYKKNVFPTIPRYGRPIKSYKRSNYPIRDSHDWILSDRRKKRTAFRGSTLPCHLIRSLASQCWTYIKSCLKVLRALVFPPPANRLRSLATKHASQTITIGHRTQTQHKTPRQSLRFHFPHRKLSAYIAHYLTFRST